MFHVDLEFARKMKDYLEGFCPEYWMDLPIEEEGTNVLSPLRVTNIPRPMAALKVKVEEDESESLEASRLDHSIEAQLVASTSIPSQSTYLLLSAITSRLVGLT